MSHVIPDIGHVSSLPASQQIQIAICILYNTRQDHKTVSQFIKAWGLYLTFYIQPAYYYTQPTYYYTQPTYHYTQSTYYTPHITTHNPHTTTHNPHTYVCTHAHTKHGSRARTTMLLNQSSGPWSFQRNLRMINTYFMIILI